MSKPRSISKLAIAITAVAILATGGAALAGSRERVTPVIGTYPDGTPYAYGAMGSARNRTTPGEEVSCTVYAFSGQQAYGSCYVLDGAGQYAACHTGEAAMVNMIAGAPSDAYVYFQWNASGQCTYLSITRASKYEPKAP